MDRTNTPVSTLRTSLERAVAVQDAATKVAAELAAARAAEQEAILARATVAGGSNVPPGNQP